MVYSKKTKRNLFYKTAIDTCSLKNGAMAVERVGGGCAWRCDAPYHHRPHLLHFEFHFRNQHKVQLAKFAVPNFLKGGWAG
jgi:hypothetical protein